MDCDKIGRLILSLRREKGMTQRQLANQLMISDKTISKWERGQGCPDVSLLHHLSEVLGVNMEEILKGDLATNREDGGNMKKIKWYVCPICGNLLTSTSEATVSCCGRKLKAMEVKEIDEKHHLTIETVEDEFYITFSHDMEKEHYLKFIAYVSCDRVLMVKLYPEQGGEIRMPQMYGGKFYFACSKDGLFCQRK